MNKIKSSINVAAIASVFLFSCQKTETNNTATTEAAETSLEQEAKMLKNDKGETIKVVYFADGDEVAVKITKEGKEHKLNARGSNNKGEPIFTDETFAWEIMESGMSGRLTDKSGTISVYKPADEQ